MSTFGLPMGLVARKPVLGVLDQTIPKQPVKLQRLARQLTDTSFVVNLDIILSKSEYLRYLSDCLGVQAGLHLCCSRTPGDSFSG